jgi:hypothetical protein
MAHDNSAHARDDEMPVGTRRYASRHPAVLAAARRTGLDPEIFATLREIERGWPRA